MARNPSLSQQKATRRCVIASLRRKIACLQRKFVELEQELASMEKNDRHWYRDTQKVMNNTENYDDLFQEFVDLLVIERE